MVIPSCWALLAKNNAIPQQIPPVIRVFFSSFVCGFLLPRPILSNKKITGTKTALPIRERIPLKENGPTASPPVLCATNATPQISAVSTSKREFLICLLFMLSNPHLLSFLLSCRYADFSLGKQLSYFFTVKYDLGHMLHLDAVKGIGGDVFGCLLQIADTGGVFKLLHHSGKTVLGHHAFVFL